MVFYCEGPFGFNSNYVFGIRLKYTCFVVVVVVVVTYYTTDPPKNQKKTTVEINFCFCLTIYLYISVFFCNVK